jgi:hypothetical protein
MTNDSVYRNLPTAFNMSTAFNALVFYHQSPSYPFIERIEPFDKLLYAFCFVAVQPANVYLYFSSHIEFHQI